jgi:hypothetical protein
MDALALFYFGGGGAGVYAPWFEIARCDGGEAEDCTFADVDSGCDAGAGADPGVGADFHRVGEKREGWIVEVMRGSAEVGVLREDGVGSEMDRSGVVDFRVITRSDLVGADEVPRSPDARAWIEVAVRSDLGAEETEKHGSPCVKGTRRQTVQDCPGDVPDESRDAIAERERGSQVGIFGGGGGDVLRRVVVDLAGHLRLSLSASDLDGRLEADVTR